MGVLEFLLACKKDWFWFLSIALWFWLALGLKTRYRSGLEVTLLQKDLKTNLNIAQILTSFRDVGLVFSLTWIFHSWLAVDYDCFSDLMKGCFWLAFILSLVSALLTRFALNIILHISLHIYVTRFCPLGCLFVTRFTWERLLIDGYCTRSLVWFKTRLFSLRD